MELYRDDKCRLSTLKREDGLYGLQINACVNLHGQKAATFFSGYVVSTTSPGAMLGVACAFSRLEETGWELPASYDDLYDRVTMWSNANLQMYPLDTRGSGSVPSKTVFENRVYIPGHGQKRELAYFGVVLDARGEPFGSVDGEFEVTILGLEPTLNFEQAVQAWKLR